MTTEKKPPVEAASLCIGNSGRVSELESCLQAAPCLLAFVPCPAQRSFEPPLAEIANRSDALHRDHGIADPKGDTTT